MTKIENKPHLIKYKKTLKLIDTDNHNVNPFLPFIERFSFLDFHYATKDLISHCRWLETRDKELGIDRGIYSLIEDVSEMTFNIHALICGWEVRAYHSIEEYFNEMVCESNYPPLKTCKELDYLLDIITKDNDYSSLHGIIRVTMEFKKALLRAYCVRNKVDLAPYIYK